MIPLAALFCFGAFSLLAAYLAADDCPDHEPTKPHLSIKAAMAAAGDIPGAV